MGSTAIAQTNTWTGAGANTNWNTVANWSLNAVPTASNDVVIPTGFTVDLNVAATTKSIAVQGNTTFNINSNLSFTNASSFASKVVVNWFSASFLGGGTLTNNGTIIMTTNNSKYISGVTTLVNNGTINFKESCYFYLYDTSIIENTTTGVIDFQSNASFSYSGSGAHNLTNAGLIKKTAPAVGASDIQCNLTNSGTITVESGTLYLATTPKTLNGGTYNVSTGQTLILSSQMNVSNTLTGKLDGEMRWAGNVSVATTATFNFTGTKGVNWISGSLIGGGNLTNLSPISMESTASKYISAATTLTNKSTITFPTACYFYLYDTSILDNTTTGIIDIKSASVITYSGSEAHNLNNAGIIKKSAGDGIAYIQSNLSNTGTISVESGTLTLDAKPKTFNGGIYNVTAGKELIFSAPTSVSSTLTGVLNGYLRWSGDLTVATTATFNFTGSKGVNWASGILLGGGTLKNLSTISLDSVASKYITGVNTTLENSGKIIFPVNCYIYLYDNAAIKNLASGIIDFQSDAIISYNGSGAININNAGLIKKTAGTGVAIIYPPVTNSGIIDIVTGTLNFADGKDFTNKVGGIIKGIGTIDVPAADNFSNEGIFSPGGSTGTLSFLGVYKSTATSVLDVEINGTTQSTQYDLLAITGTNAVFEGNVKVTLGFDANVGDKFTIATVSGTIATKKLISPTYANFGCLQYTFDVSYPNDKSVVLTMSKKADVIPPVAIAKNITVQLDATGNASVTAVQVNNGSTDNCTAQANLVLTLNKTKFTCANLGANAVVLTVKDESGNASTANATVTVEDKIKPTVKTKNITVQLDASGKATITENQVNDGSSDNCTISTLSLDKTSFTCSNLGVNTVNLSVTDNSGNKSSGSATVTVQDKIAPVINCKSDVTVSGDNNGYTVPDFYALNEVTATDNCSIASTLQAPAPNTIIKVAGKTPVIITVTDGSGNVTTCTFNLDVALGKNDFKLAQAITLFPNPTTGIVTLKNESDVELTSISIIDVSGRILNVINLNGMNNQKEISLQPYSNGNYFLKIESLNSSIVKQIIKK